MSRDRELDMNTGNNTPSSNPTYDYATWPVFITRMPPSRLSPDAFRAHLVECQKPFHRSRAFCMLINMGDHPPLPAIQRKEVTEAMKADCQRHPGLLAGMAIVVHSVLGHGVMTAINWIAKPPYLFAAFDDEAPAMSWLLDQLAQRRDEVRIART